MLLTHARNRLSLLSLLLFLPSLGLCQAFGHKGLLSGWLLTKLEKAVRPQLGLRYIPEFSLGKLLSPNYSLDLEFSLNIYGTGQFESSDEFNTDSKIKPYRLWLRFSSSQFEARLGLQKINFGSATLLRPLMWFDRIDPRDPLQITDGVYGLLLRYYFVNNTNMWFWALFGNDDPKGWEVIPSDKDSLEYGGRFQFPFFKGELAFTYHHRRINLRHAPLPQPLSSNHLAPENRYALDGKLDIGVGVWFEGVLIHQDTSLLPFNWRRAINLGMDYTFGIGNGLNVLGEHFILTSSKNAFGSGKSQNFSALSVRYNLSLLDNLSTIFYYDWENKDLYRFLNWQRTYDRWSFHAIGFWNPRRFQIYPGQTGIEMFVGKGFQIMVIFNY